MASDSVTMLTRTELDAGLDEIRRSPKHEGVLELIVRRPYVSGREVLETARLDVLEGLEGDSWSCRPGSHRRGEPHPDMQINIMNARAIALVARSRDRWALAGDQLYVDLDLSVDNVPPGTRLAIGTAIVEITDRPHTGCSKFAARFGIDAVSFVNSAAGRQLNLSGVNARVVQSGSIGVGMAVVKIA